MDETHLSASRSDDGDGAAAGCVQPREAGDGLAGDARLVRGHARRARELADGVPYGPRRPHEDARVDVRQRRAAVEPVGLQQRERAHHAGRRRRLPPLPAAAALLRRRPCRHESARATTIK
jgi:hypothetical protein